MMKRREKLPQYKDTLIVQYGGVLFFWANEPCTLLEMGRRTIGEI